MSQQVSAANEHNPAANPANRISVRDEDENLFEISAEDRLRISLIQSLLRSLTGKEIEFSITDLRLPNNNTLKPSRHTSNQTLHSLKTQRL